MKLKKIQSKLYNIIFQKPCIRILEQNGMKHGSNFSVQKGCIIDDSHCFLISFGNNVTLAPNVHILAHDASTKIFLNYTKIAKVRIGNNVFIGADTVILPGVSVGDNVIIGANSVVTCDLDSNHVYAGNPAKKIMKLEDYLSKYNSNKIKTYDHSYRIDEITSQKKEELLEQLDNDKYVLLD